ncbi:RNA polymerase factor sigma-54 [Paenibacillus sp. GYB003]|uniref:RNA polymerase factor sigma-54 n=1 Tax=Paenibacillus sp. GYB003 TaxID=2994392 RepID=UPI002F969FFF
MIGPRLLQEQHLKLAITPELKQSIRILAMSGDELFRYAQEQALDNPLLDCDERPGRIRRSEPSAYGRRAVRRTADADYDPLRNAADAGRVSLEQRLLGELRQLALPPELYRIAAYLAGNVTESGYLDVPLEDVCAALGVTERTAAEALGRLQSLDPPGIGARTLRECLLLQIDRDRNPAPFARDIADRFLPHLARGKLDAIAGALRADKAQVAAAASYIRGLDPRPGLSASDEPPVYVVPDAVVEAAPDGFAVEMNPASVPRLSLNGDYCRLLDGPVPPEASAFLTGRLQSAQWLIRCLRMRQRTLSGVIRAMFEEQPHFLAEGVGALRPMTMATIAEKLGIHESTVSRAVRDKSVRTPHGVFPLKFFFSSGLASEGGGTVSAKAVKLRIRRLIEGENKSRPYSDREIARELAAQGVTLSRRTVAKYRDELNILPSSLRRREECHTG